MRALVMVLACGAGVTLNPSSPAHAQSTPDSLVRRRIVVTEYDERTDSTTRRVSAYALVDTSRTPPDTFALELRQMWRGPGPVARGGPIDLGVGRTRAEGLRGGRSLLGSVPRPPLVVLLDEGRPIRLAQAEYTSDGGRVPTFETAWYRVSAADLRRIAASGTLRVRIGDRELWIDAAWRAVAAELLADPPRR